MVVWGWEDLNPNFSWESWSPFRGSDVTPWKNFVDIHLQAVLPQAVRHWTLTTLLEKLIKIGAKVVRHSRKIVFQMAEVAVPRELFQTILERIGRLRLPAVATG